MNKIVLLLVFCQSTFCGFIRAEVPTDGSIKTEQNFCFQQEVVKFVPASLSQSTVIFLVRLAVLEQEVEKEGPYLLPPHIIVEEMFNQVAEGKKNLEEEIASSFAQEDYDLIVQSALLIEKMATQVIQTGSLCKSDLEKTFSLIDLIISKQHCSLKKTDLLDILFHYVSSNALVKRWRKALSLEKATQATRD